MPSSIDRIWHIAYYLMNEHSFKVVWVTTKDLCYKSSVYDDIIDQLITSSSEFNKYLVTFE